MGIFGPDFTNGMAAGFNGQGLQQALLNKQLQNQAMQRQAQDEIRSRQAKALIGQVIQEAMSQQGGQGGQGMVPGTDVPMFKPPQQPQAPGQPPMGGAANVAAPQDGTPPTEGTTMPEGGGTQPGTPQLGQGGGMPQPPAMGGQQAPGQQGAQPPQAGAQGQPQGAAKALDWNAIAAAVQRKTNAPPELIFQAIQEIAPQLDREATLRSHEQVAQWQIDQKNQALLQNLQMQYDRTASQVTKAQIMADMRRVTTQMMDTSREGIAAGNNASRERVATANNTSREGIAARNNETKITTSMLSNDAKLNIAQTTNDLKRELGTRKLDLTEQQIENTKTYQDRVADLKERGLDENHAQFQAKMEQGLALATMRDETTRRAQDLIHADKGAALAGKLDLVRAKAAQGADAAISGYDQLIADAHGLLADPNLDKSVGARVSHMPGFMDQDVQNFRDKLNSFRSEKLMSLVTALKATGNGSTGFGRITNFEAQQLQNSIASLQDTQDPEQFRAALLKMINVVSQSKAKVVQSYQDTYASPVAKGPVAVGDVKPKLGGKSIDFPPELAGELAASRDGRPVTAPDGTKYIKRGNKLVEAGG